MFAEFLLFLLVFPLMAHQCGVNGCVLDDFLVYHVCLSIPSLFGAVKFRWLVRFDVHVCWERSADKINPLVTHVSIIASMFAWNGLIGLGG